MMPGRSVQGWHKIAVLSEALEILMNPCAIGSRHVRRGVSKGVETADLWEGHPQIGHTGVSGVACLRRRRVGHWEPRESVGVRLGSPWIPLAIRA
jgi:hypothetical protein